MFGYKVYRKTNKNILKQNNASKKNMKLMQVSLEGNQVVFNYKLTDRDFEFDLKIPMEDLENYLIDERLVITSGVVYQNNSLRDPLLYRDSEAWIYRRRSPIN